MMESVEVISGKISVLLDKEDMDRFFLHSWGLNKNGRVCTRIGTRKEGNRKSLLLSHFLLGISDSSVFVKYLNGNRLDNRKTNMTVSSVSELMFGVSYKNKINQSSKYRGVGFCKQTKNWKVTITDNNKKRITKRLKTEKEAALFYNDLAKKYHGDKAILNEVI